MPFRNIRNIISKVKTDPVDAPAGSRFDDLRSYIDKNYVPGTDVEFCQHDSPSVGAAFSSPNRGEHRRRQERDARPEGSAGGFMPLETPQAAADSLEELLRQQEKTFSEYLLDLLRERDGKDSEVYRRAVISRQLFSKILNDRDYQPTKNTVLQLAIGLQLDLPQTEKLLGKAGYALTRSSKTDLVVRYYIERKVYNVAFINEALYDCGLPLLKTGLKT